MTSSLDRDGESLTVVVVTGGLTKTFAIPPMPDLFERLSRSATWFVRVRGGVELATAAASARPTMAELGGTATSAFMAGAVLTSLADRRLVPVRVVSADVSEMGRRELERPRPAESAERVDK